MHDTHVYEIPGVGEVLFRRGSIGSNKVIRCKIVRTRAVVAITELTTAALISVVGAGETVCHFDKWFAGWSDQDNTYGVDMQSGRPIDVAIPVDVLEDMIVTGHQPYYQAIEAGSRGRPYTIPVIAVLIDGRWEEPVLQD